jgi:hypothetical protein
MSNANRRRYRNDVRLPLILFLFVVGGLVSGRWMLEMRVHHESQRLAVEERNLQHQISELNRDITDLGGRLSSLTTRDAVKQALTERGISMTPIKGANIIILDGSSLGLNTRATKEEGR